MLNNESFIFLDIDGVLNSEYTRFAPSCGYGPATWDGMSIHSIELLNTLVKQTGAKIILSSSWKHYRSVMFCQSHLNKYGLNVSINERTTNLPDHNHGKEIKHWIKKNSWRIKSFVVFDDLVNVYGHGFDDRIVLTSDQSGLNKSDVELASKILEKEWIRK